MKEISKNSEQTWYLVEKWETRSGLIAKVCKCVWSERIKSIAHSLHDYYTGYVQIPDGVKVNESNLVVHGGVTFGPSKLHDEEEYLKWVGFDINHYGDEDNQALDYVKSECEKLAAQIK